MNQVQPRCRAFFFEECAVWHVGINAGNGNWALLYTPLLPVMLAENLFTFPQLSWIASINYAGYLVGSLLFSFSLFHLPSRLRLDCCFQLSLADY